MFHWMASGALVVSLLELSRDSRVGEFVVRIDDSAIDRRVPASGKRGVLMRLGASDDSSWLTCCDSWRGELERPAVGKGVLVCLNCIKSYNAALVLALSGKALLCGYRPDADGVVLQRFQDCFLTGLDAGFFEVLSPALSSGG